MAAMGITRIIRGRREEKKQKFKKKNTSLPRLLERSKRWREEERRGEERPNNIPTAVVDGSFGYNEFGEGPAPKDEKNCQMRD